MLYVSGMTTLESVIGNGIAALAGGVFILRVLGVSWAAIPVIGGMVGFIGLIFVLAAWCNRKGV